MVAARAVVAVFVGPVVLHSPPVALAVLDAPAPVELVAWR